MLPAFTKELFHLVLVGIQTVFRMPNSQKFCKGIEPLVLLVIESKLLAFTITSTLYATRQPRLHQTCKTIS